MKHIIYEMATFFGVCYSVYQTSLIIALYYIFKYFVFQPHVNNLDFKIPRKQIELGDLMISDRPTQLK